MECNEYLVEGVCKKAWKKAECRNDEWDANKEYFPRGKCFHKETLVTISIDGKESKIVTLEEISQGQQVLT
jgi:hypothetical protein